LTVTFLAKNSSQVEGRFIIGSRIVTWGSSNTDQAQIGTETVGTYTVPAGKRAIVEGMLTVTDITTHSFASLGVFDSVTTFIANIAVLSGVGSVKFITELGEKQSLVFGAQSGEPNDMKGGCVCTVQELPE